MSIEELKELLDLHAVQRLLHKYPTTTSNRQFINEKYRTLKSGKTTHYIALAIVDALRDLEASE